MSVIRPCTVRATIGDPLEKRAGAASVAGLACPSFYLNSAVAGRLTRLSRRSRRRLWRRCPGACGCCAYLMTEACWRDSVLINVMRSFECWPRAIGIGAKETYALL